MKKLITSFVSLTLIATILAPSFVKLSHAIFEHQELTCVDTSISHVHEVEFDCEFQKFKLSPQTLIEFPEITKISTIEIDNQSYDRYVFLSYFQELPFALRGPPSVV